MITDSTHYVQMNEREVLVFRVERCMVCGAEVLANMPEVVFSRDPFINDEHSLVFAGLTQWHRPDLPKASDPQWTPSGDGRVCTTCKEKVAAMGYALKQPAMPTTAKDAAPEPPAEATEAWQRRKNLESIRDELIAALRLVEEELDNA